MKNKFAKFILFIILCFIVGMVIGFVSSSNIISIKNFLLIIFNFIENKAIYLYIFIYIMLIVSFCFYYKATKINVDDEDKIKEIDKLLENSLGLSSISMVVCFIVFGLSTINLDQIIISVLLFVIYIGLFIYLQYLVIEKVKKNNPEKKADYFDMKFDEKWYEDCDELERKEIGLASYRAYKVTFKVIILCYLVSVILVYNHIVDSYVLIIIGIIWLALIIS